MKFLLPQGLMLTKTKNIRKKNKKKNFEKENNCFSIWPRGSNNQKLKEINALGSEIIATRTDRRRTKSHTIGSADIVKQS